MAFEDEGEKVIWQGKQKLETFIMDSNNAESHS